jgi:hypothetical protein
MLANHRHHEPPPRTCGVMKARKGCNLQVWHRRGTTGFIRTGIHSHWNGLAGAVFICSASRRKVPLPCLKTTLRVDLLCLSTFNILILTAGGSTQVRTSNLLDQDAMKAALGLESHQICVILVLRGLSSAVKTNLIRGHLHLELDFASFARCLLTSAALGPDSVAQFAASISIASIKIARGPRTQCGTLGMVTPIRVTTLN